MSADPQGPSAENDTPSRTTRRPRRRGKSFSAAEQAVFEARGITRAQKDRLALVTDPVRRQEIIARIGAGEEFQRAYDAVLLPPGAVTEDIGINEAVNGPVPDEEWLEEFPIRHKVVTPRFDAQALAYRRLADARGKLNKAYIKARKEFGRLAAEGKGFLPATGRYLALPHPMQWKICGSCGGTGQLDDRPCRDCGANGFVTY